MKKTIVYFLRRQLIYRDYYFNYRCDADRFINDAKKQYNAKVLCYGANYDNNIPYAYRVSLEIEIYYDLQEVSKNEHKR